MLETAKSQTRGGRRIGVCDSPAVGWNPYAGRKWFEQLSIDGWVVPQGGWCWSPRLSCWEGPAGSSSAAPVTAQDTPNSHPACAGPEGAGSPTVREDLGWCCYCHGVCWTNSSFLSCARFLLRVANQRVFNTRSNS